MANLRELRQERIKKLEDIKKLGINPYAQDVSPERIKIGDLVDDFDNQHDLDFTVAGRITSLRLMGGLGFMDVQDGSGKIQLVVKKNEEKVDGELSFDQLQLLSGGDYVQASGKAGLSQSGEKSLFPMTVKLLSKSIRPLPDAHEGLSNIETRYRQRYVDTIVNKEVKEVLEKRIAITKELRNFMEEQDFVEIETPVLQPVYGGASARPFQTYHHKLESDLFLRIADELYLKRAIIAGFDKVYEIGHDFRNEGIDPAHNPEFTMLEFYWAYATYDDLMTLTEQMLERVCQNVMGTTEIEYQGAKLNFKAPFERLTFREAVLRETEVDIDAIDRDGLIEEFKKRNIQIDLETNPPMKDLLDEFFKATTRPKLVGPLFLTDYPAEMKPLAKTRHDDQTKSASMQLVVNGEELINAYNELNDPKTQLENWQKEQKVLDAGESEEAQPLDYDFVRALEYGMPPTAGWGMGIDRFAQVLCNQPSVKDTIFFPTLRREQFDPTEFEY